jgi:hypothetical protein
MAFGIVFGVSAALTGSLDLTAHWLLTAYLLVVLLAANGRALVASGCAFGRRRGREWRPGARRSHSIGRTARVVGADDHDHSGDRVRDGHEAGPARLELPARAGPTG